MPFGKEILRWPENAFQLALAREQKLGRLNFCQRLLSQLTPSLTCPCGTSAHRQRQSCLLALCAWGLSGEGLWACRWGQLSREAVQSPEGARCCGLDSGVRTPAPGLTRAVGASSRELQPRSCSPQGRGTQPSRGGCVSGLLGSPPVEPNVTRMVDGMVTGKPSMLAWRPSGKQPAGRKAAILALHPLAGAPGRSLSLQP